MSRPNINNKLDHEKCRDCDYAVYCYTKPSLWIFRTQEEMERKIAYMELCPIRKNMVNSREGKSEEEQLAQEI